MGNDKDTKPRPGIGYLIVYSDMQDSPAFNAMRPLAQLLVMKAKRFYDRKTQGPVRVSERTAAMLTGTTGRTARSLCREAVHYAFWRKHSGGYLGSKGKGIAATYQLTDEMFTGHPATLDFLYWDGTPFHESHTPSCYRRKEQRLARLMAFKTLQPGSPLPSRGNQKTESRGRHPPNPAVDTHPGPAVDTHPGSQKVQQIPAVDTHRISREDSCSSSTAAEPVDVSQGVPEPKPEPTPAGQPLEHGLQVMLDLLRDYLGNNATRTEWMVEIQKRFTGRDGKLRRGWTDDSIDRKIDKLEALGYITGGRRRGEYYSAVLARKLPANENAAENATDFIDVLTAAKLQILL
jgi:hypothetical protein